MRTRKSLRGVGLTVSALLVLGALQFATPPAEAQSLATPKATSSAAVRGVPPGGPSVLYAPASAAAELRNHDPRFRAPYEQVSGTERYVNGEYLYTDFLYDDEETTYPGDAKRHGNNAGDLAEFRVSTRGDELAVRLSMTTLLVKDATIATLAFDSDRNAATGNSTLPRDPGLPFPGTDQVLTTWGTGAEWSSCTGQRWKTVPLKVSTDLEANQITVTVPHTVANPTGRWAATLAVGAYDPATRGWLATESSHGSKIVNLGFRFDETTPTPRYGPLNVYDAHPYLHQNAALEAGRPTTYARMLDFDLLDKGGERDNVPTHGYLYRMFASRLESVDVRRTGAPGAPIQDVPMREGKDLASAGPQFLSKLQPYLLYVPSNYEQGRKTPLTFGLHGDGGNYYASREVGPRLDEQLGENRGSIVAYPSSRGHTGFWVKECEYQLFEVWNDVARRYTLDPRRTAVAGYSMGGYGAYRFGLLYPHLFSRVLAGIPAGMRGFLWIPGVSDDETVLNRWLENARNLPIFHIGDMASELTYYPGQFLNVAGPAVGGLQSLDALGYRYKFWSVTADHVLIGIDFPKSTTFLGQHTIEPEPFHVTFSRLPSNEAPKLGLVHDQAYWVSKIELRDATETALPPTQVGPPHPYAKGTVDAVSLGFGKADPTSSLRHSAGVTERSPYVPGAPGYPFVEQERVWAEPGKVAVENRIVLKTKNVRSLTIDPVAARVGCDVTLDVHSDGPVKVTLRGCPSSATRPAARSRAASAPAPQQGSGATLTSRDSSNAAPAPPNGPGTVPVSLGLAETGASPSVLAPLLLLGAAMVHRHRRRRAHSSPPVHGARSRR